MNIDPMISAYHVKAYQGDPLEKLVEDHWKYIKELLVAHGEEEYVIGVCEFHYKSAFKHGFKHAAEDCECAVINNDAVYGGGS